MYTAVPDNYKLRTGKQEKEETIFGQFSFCLSVESKSLGWVEFSIQHT